MTRRFLSILLLLSIIACLAACHSAAAAPGAADQPPAGRFILLAGDRQAVIVFNPADGEYVGTSLRNTFHIKPQDDLASYLEKATGKKFTVVAEADYKPDPSHLPIYVGHCTATEKALGAQLARLDRDAFIIRVEPTQVFLAGPMIHSTCWAEMQFLEDYLNIRWLFPGPLGTDVPHADQVVIDSAQKIDSPAVLGRLWSGSQQPADGPEWSFRQRIYFQTGEVATKGRYEFQHNMSNIFPSDKYYDKHPEYYALIKGVREKVGYAKGVNICLSNPDTIPIAAQAAIDYFKAHPERESYSFGPNDGGHWCECENCQKIMLSADRIKKATPADDPIVAVWRGKMSAAVLYWDWLSKVAAIVQKECPGKLLGTLAYSAYTTPPVINPEIKVDPSILPFMCFCQGDLWQADSKKAADYLVDEWAKRVKGFGLYDYAYGAGEVLPRIYTPLVQQTIQAALPKGLKGCYAEVYPNWGTDGPRLSQIAKVWWNPKIDLDADLKDWCDHAFKEASAPMQEHFRKCAQEWVASKQDQYNVRKRPGTVAGFTKPYQFLTGWRTAPLEVFTPELIAEHTKYFDQAARLVKDETAKQRLAWFRDAWDTGCLFADAYWAGEGLETYIARGAKITQVAAALKKMAPAYDEPAWQAVVDAHINTGDKAKWYPIDKSDFRSLPVKPVRDSDLNWCALQIVEAQRTLYKDNMLTDPPLADAVKKEIQTTFEKGMENASDNYKQAVAKIQAAAAAELKKTPE